MVFITLLATALVSGIGWRGWDTCGPRVLLHLGILGSLILLLIAWQYRLDALQLVYSARGAVFGAGYTDVRAQLPAYNILFVITLITAVSCCWSRSSCAGPGGQLWRCWPSGWPRPFLPATSIRRWCNAFRSAPTS